MTDFQSNWFRPLLSSSASRGAVVLVTPYITFVFPSEPKESWAPKLCVWKTSDVVYAPSHDLYEAVPPFVFLSIGQRLVMGGCSKGSRR